MRLLLDTHTLIWFLEGSAELPDASAKRIEAADADVAVSLASIWEMAVKVSIGRLRVPYDFEADLPKLLEEQRIPVLAPSFADLQSLIELPFHHRDPFDRMIVAQALGERRSIISRDTALDAYGVERIW